MSDDTITRLGASLADRYRIERELGADQGVRVHGGRGSVPWIVAQGL